MGRLSAGGYRAWAATTGGRRAAYAGVFVLLLAAYAIATSMLWAHRGWSDQGPLSYHQPAATAVLPGSGPSSLDDVKRACETTRDVHGDLADIKVVAAVVDGHDYYACYRLRDGKVYEATVIDPSGAHAPDSVIKQGGAWRWYGLIKTPFEIALGGVAIVVLGALFFLYYRRDRPAAPRDPRWWETSAAQSLFCLLCLVQPISLLFRRGESGARRLRLLMQWGMTLIVGTGALLFLPGHNDGLSTTAGLIIGAALLSGYGLGRLLVAPVGFGRTPDREVPAALVGGMPITQVPGPDVAVAPIDPQAAGSTGSVAGVSQQAASQPRPAPSMWASRIRRPSSLPSFADVGGMAALKEEIDDSLGLLLAFSGEAEAYRISFNGILLHGDPGVGKSFFAQATAGEYGLNLLPVTSGDLVSKYVGESARNVAEIFREAARNVPCLLFFDEFDSIATRRDEGLSDESTRIVNQLLQSIEEWRTVPNLVVMAATNHLDRLDPAVVRPGRFDRQIRVDLPDQEARLAVLTAQLERRPLAADVDLDDIARRLAGRTPAVIARVANAAAMTAFHDATEGGGGPVAISQEMLRGAITGLGGKDRPTVEDWSWDKLVLAPETKAELQQVAALVKEPDIALRYGIAPPSGLLLTGPPGTGKTTIARVFAAQSGCSFYPQTASDLTSKWVGESEANLTRLFARARENAPSIIFLDEIDAVASARSELGSSYLDRTLTQLLTEMDGLTEQRGVFVLAATNRPDVLDPALLRGGRLSRTIEIPLPDEPQRRQLLELFTHGMPLDGVDLDALAAQTDGLAGADLEAVCQQAALEAMVAQAAAGSPDAPASIGPQAFAKAIAAKRSAPHGPFTPEITAPHDRHRGNYL